jgi:nitrate/nitrite transporter NarK
MKQLLHIIMTACGLVLFCLSGGYFCPQLFGAYAKPLGLYYAVCAFTSSCFLVCMPTWRWKIRSLKCFGKIT